MQADTDLCSDLNSIHSISDFLFQAGWWVASEPASLPVRWRVQMGN